MPHSGHWIQGAVHHKGALTAIAKRKGISLSKEIRVGLHSKNAHVRHMALFAKSKSPLAVVTERAPDSPLRRHAKDRP